MLRGQAVATRGLRARSCNHPSARTPTLPTSTAPLLRRLPLWCEQDCKTALMAAAENNAGAVAKLLIEAKANLEVTDKVGPLGVVLRDGCWPRRGAVSPSGSCAGAAAARLSARTLTNSTHFNHHDRCHHRARRMARRR